MLEVLGVGGFKTLPGTVLMVAGTWLVLEDLSPRYNLKFYRWGGGESAPPLTPETPTPSVRGERLALEDCGNGAGEFCTSRIHFGRVHESSSEPDGSTSELCTENVRLSKVPVVPFCEKPERVAGKSPH